MTFFAVEAFTCKSSPSGSLSNALKTSQKVALASDVAIAALTISAGAFLMVMQGTGFLNVSFVPQLFPHMTEVGILGGAGLIGLDLVKLNVQLNRHIGKMHNYIQAQPPAGSAVAASGDGHTSRITIAASGDDNPSPPGPVGSPPPPPPGPPPPPSTPSTGLKITRRTGTPGGSAARPPEDKPAFQASDIRGVVLRHVDSLPAQKGFDPSHVIGVQLRATPPPRDKTKTSGGRFSPKEVNDKKNEIESNFDFFTTDQMREFEGMPADIKEQMLCNLEKHVRAEIRSLKSNTGKDTTGVLSGALDAIRTKVAPSDDEDEDDNDWSDSDLDAAVPVLTPQDQLENALRDSISNLGNSKDELGLNRAKMQIEKMLDSLRNSSAAESSGKGEA